MVQPGSFTKFFLLCRTVLHLLKAPPTPPVGLAARIRYLCRKYTNTFLFVQVIRSLFFAYFPIKHYFTGSNSLSKANPEFACMFPRRFSMPNQLNDLPLNQRAR